MKILIAEDDRAHQEINKILMEDWEFEFDMISSGRKAFDLAKANEGEYDLCLMDIDLPGMNGWDAARLIRQELKYIPIVALTANPWFNDKYLEIGMDDYIEKPYDIDQLYLIVAKSVKVPASRRQGCRCSNLPQNLGNEEDGIFTLFSKGKNF